MFCTMRNKLLYKNVIVLIYFLYWLFILLHFAACYYSGFPLHRENRENGEKFSRQGKQREFENFAKTQGKHWELENFSKTQGKHWAFEHFKIKSCHQECMR